MPIIISKHGQNAQVINQSPFEYEDSLQEYIHRNPESIPVYELQENKRLYVAVRELSTNSGPIDALGIDEDGDLYVIETKLWKNPDKRTVIAQALDYGAALWKHTTDFAQFLSVLDRETQKTHGMDFQEKVADFFGIEFAQTDSIIERMSQNLQAGVIKFVILMDSIGDRLKDLILYVNQNSQFGIYGVEFKFYKHEEYEIVIPKIFGVEVKKSITTRAKKSIDPHFATVIEYYEKHPVTGMTLLGGGITYRKVKPVNWPDGVHYELLFQNDMIKVDLHLESDDVAFLGEHLKKFDGTLLQGKYQISWDDKYSRKRGRLTAPISKTLDPSIIVAAIKELVSMTKGVIDNELKSKSSTPDN